MEAYSNDTNQSATDVGTNFPDDADDVDEHFCLKCKMTIKGLENYIFHRKNECIKASNDIKANAGAKDLCNPVESSTSQEAMSTCTATDALASEAAFMENIGLYLTPKPLLHNPRPPLSIAGFTSPRAHNSQSQWEEDLVLEWHNENEILTSSNENSNRTKEVHSTPEAKSFNRSQHSLLSYLPTKGKTTRLSSTEIQDSSVVIENSANDSGGISKEDEFNIENIASHLQKGSESLNIPSQSEFMKQIELLNTSDRLPEIGSRDSILLPVTPSKLKLWNPERENTVSNSFSAQTSEEIWNDVLESSVMESGRLYIQHIIEMKDASFYNRS